MRTRTMVLGLLMTCPVFGQAKLPPYTKQALGNGATLILLRKPDVPLISVRAMFRGGAEAEPEGQAGIAGLTAELIRRGTAQRTADQISLEMDSLGATVGGGSDRQASYLYTEFMARTQAPALQVFADLLVNASFPEGEVKKALAQAVDAAKSAKDNPGMAIGRYFNAFYYGAAHPYGRVADEETLGRLNREQIVGFHKKMYVGRNLMLIAAGDFDPAKLGPQLAALAGQLPAGGAFQPGKVAAPGFETARLLLVDKPDATQTYFRIGMPGIARTNPDRVALMIVNTLFGGRFTSMLNDELRVNAGLTYGANCMLEQDRLTGAISINTYTRTETTEKAMDMALAVLKRLREKGLDAEQLASAKAYIKGGYPTQRLETADQLAGLIGELEIFDLSKAEVDDLFAKIDSITVAQANAVARKYYTEERLQFCLVGNAGKMQDAVKKYAAKMKVHPVKSPGFAAPAF
ncbi:MAG: insulinase family protein [Candidatus Solibacter usitatus]|nr:insulinase family protein [Candidatus Solibacter usitatus]